MENEQPLAGSFKNELDAITGNTILDPVYRRKKWLFWAVRTILTVVLYIVFWEHTWVRWTLLVTVPLSLFSLFAVLGMPYLLKRKIERARRKIEEADKIAIDS